MAKRRKQKTTRQKKKTLLKTERDDQKANIVVKIDGQISSEEQPSFYSSGDLIGSNEDLLRNILILVSEKPLSRFKSVSKLWLSIISDPDFTLTWHTKHVPSPSALIVGRYKFIPLDEREKNSVSPFSNSFSPLSNCTNCDETEMIGSCNGLLLLKTIPQRLYVALAVLNPTTNQLKLIPQMYRVHYAALAFDPLKSPHYKVLLLSKTYYNNRNSYRIEIGIYESGIDLLRPVPLGEDSLLYTIDSYEVILQYGVYWKGAIHWACLEKSSCLYFDFETECCMKMPMPPIQGNQKKRSIRYFGESGGHLLLIDYEDDFALQFDVFEMESDYSKWFVKYSVDLVPFCWRFNAVDLCNKKVMFLSLVINGREVEGEEEWPLLLMYVSKTKMVISYNLKEEELKNVARYNIDSLDFRGRRWFHSSDFRVYPFIRSPTTTIL